MTYGYENKIIDERKNVHMNTKSLQISSGNLIVDRRYAYALEALAQEDFQACVELMGQTLEMAPDYTPLWILLGHALAALGENSQAIEALQKALHLDPSDALGAKMALVRLGVGKTSEALSASFVAGLFDQYADRFEKHLVNDLKYCAPNVLYEALKNVCGGLNRPFSFARALDLGCGTGLMGEGLAPVVDHLEGCDLSAKMVAKARAKNIYNALDVMDMQTFMTGQPPTSVDLIIAADVLVYMGDLAPLLCQCALALQPQGLIAFTLQSYENDMPLEGYRLGEDQRFAHTHDYVMRTLQASGLICDQCDPQSTRYDRGQPIAGWCVVAHKG
jgi:predicted TPR repeat methyltransferase